MGNRKNRSTGKHRNRTIRPDNSHVAEKVPAGTGQNQNTPPPESDAIANAVTEPEEGGFAVPKLPANRPEDIRPPRGPPPLFDPCDEDCSSDQVQGSGEDGLL